MTSGHLSATGAVLPSCCLKHFQDDGAVALTGAGGAASRAFALDGKPPRVRDRYGRHRFGRALLQTPSHATLIAAVGKERLRTILACQRFGQP